MKFAFIVMGAFDYQQDRASIHEGLAQIIGVANIEEACIAAKELEEHGIDCIELCGAFGEIGAKLIIDATQNRIPIGYITHLAKQDILYEQVFEKKKEDKA